MLDILDYNSTENKPTRHGFGEGLAELGEELDNLVVIGTDVTGSVMTSLFQQKFPDRFISIGVAEQNATTIAAGMALSGKIPVFSSYSAFAAFRNADQIRVSVCYNNVNVKIGGGHSGITVGPDGATHQSLEEISMLRAMPNLTIVVPADYHEAKKATKAICRMNGPAFLRFGRSPVPVFTNENTEFVQDFLCNRREKDKFIKKVTTIRNYLTHPKNDLEGRKYTNKENLIILSHFLKILLEIVFLKEIGFDSDETKKIILKQYERFKKQWKNS